MPERPNLSGRKLRAFKILANGGTVAEVAARLGVTDRSVRRWRSDPAFREALAEAGLDALEAARDALEAAAHDAADFLVELVQDTSRAPSVRLQAAVGVLDRIGIVAGQRVKIEGSEGGGSALEMSDGSIIVDGVRYVPEGRT